LSMASTTDIRNGLIIRFKGKLWEIVEFLHVKPGKGGAFVRTKLKNIQTGQVVENTFRGSDKFESIRVQAKKMEYLYGDSDFYIFMDTATYEQISIPRDVIGEDKYFLLENIQLKIKFDQDDQNIVLGVELPTKVTLKVKDCEPNVKGNSASTSYKNAKTETDLSILVPFFVEIGDLIKVDTRTRKYVERVK